jgi:peptidyl-prolyl cis-trans isomerase C
MGLLDAVGNAFKGAFNNQDYSNSAAQYEQTNARASHVLVDSQAEAQRIKDEIAAGMDFTEAALKYSTCSSASRGGKLGKFVPGTMAKEFEDIVFGLYDTGELNPKNESILYKPKYELDEVHGPVQTKFGWHLIKIETRFIADYDFRLKETPVTEI